MKKQDYIVALAAACELPVEDAHKHFSDKDPHRITAKVNAMLDAVEYAGFDLDEIDPLECIAGYPKSHQALSKVMLNHPARMHKFWKNGSNYLFFNNKGECWAVVNGVVQGGFSRSCAVSQIWVVKPKAQQAAWARSASSI